MSEVNVLMAESIQISYEQLTQGSYVRIGDDLQISTDNLWGDTESVLLKNYFITSPDLVTEKGSTLKGNIVNLLAVDSQPNTSNVAFDDPNAIGKITTADLPVVVQRADQFIELQKGDLIYLNDVIDAKDGSVGIAFKDDSSISVDPGAKMLIDDFVYDPAEPTVGSMNANIITGNFSFISGQIAKTGNDAMQVTTPVLTIGVRGTQVAGKANQDGEENEIVLLPNEDGTVGQVLITNQSGSVLLTEAFQATTIATALQPPTVPVILPKEIVLKKFAKTIATTKKTKKLRETEKEAEEAAKEKVEAEEEKEELEEEKEELEEEAEELEEEKEQLEEEAEALEEEAEALEEEKEQIEEQAEAIEEEKEQVEEQAEQLEEKAEELEKKLEEVPLEEKEQIEKELEAIEEEILEVEEIKEEIEQKVQEVEEKIQEVEEKEQFIEEKAVEIEQQVKDVEQQVQIVEEKFVEVEQQFVVIEEKIIQVEQKFIDIEQDFEQFQQEFVQEFKEFILEEELQQFVNEAPLEIIQDVQEMIREDIKNNPEMFNDQPVEIEEEIIDEDPFKETPGEELEQDGIMEPEQDLDQMNNEFDQFVNEDVQDGPGYNEDDDVFNVPEDEQVDINVEEFLQEEKELAIQNNELSKEAEDFFNDEQIQEALPEEIDQNVQDLMIIQAGDLNEYFVGAGDGINNADDYFAQDQNEDFYNIVDNNEELYNAEREAQDFMDQLINNLAQDQNINVAPWLDMPNDTSVSESLSVGTTLGYVYGSDANGDQLTYSILSDETGKIAIDGNRLYLNSAFDNISSDTDYTVLLKVQDPYGSSDVDQWTVTVTADSGPTLSSTSIVSMAENASDGATVADIDHTGGSGTVSYSITAGNSEGKFSINSSTGVITYNTQAAVLTTETFESTTEGATPTGWTGATVDDTTYYGKILGRFNGDSNTGQDVYKTFDFDSSYANKRVQIDFNFWEFGTWDAVNHGSLDQRFMVYVNDTLVVQDLRRYTGNNQQKYGETVGNLGTGWTPSPVESGMATLNSHQEGELYRLYGTLDSNGDIKLGFGARLDESLSNESGAVDNIKISLTDLNYEDATSHTLTITATDASNNTDTVSQTITVTDVNEAPYFIDNVYAARSIAENGSSGTDVARVHAEDLEGDSITYSITAGNTGNKFTINSSNGLIETAGALDYETTSSYTLTVTATDEHNVSGTTTITVNVTDDTSDNTFTQGISNTSIDAWGARYSQDMVLNNAWAEGKILALHGDRSISGTNQAGDKLDDLFSVTYDTDSNGNWASNTLKYASQFSQIWDFNWNTRINNNSSLTDAWKAYLMSGGSLVSITEHQSWDNKRNQDQEDFINVIDTTSSTNNGMINGVGNGTQNIQAEYRAWSDTDSVLSATVGGATSVYHKEYMGRGDLVSVSAGDGNDGAIAEWSREDTEAEYTGTFLAWGDIDGHSYTSYVTSADHHKEIATWLQEQNEDAMTESDGAGIVVDSEYLPMFQATQNGTRYTTEDTITAVEAIHLGNNVYIGGGMDHIDLVWDDSADAAYWAFNTDMDGVSNPTQADDHYGVIGYDRDGDGDLWETTDTFNLDKIKILDDSEDYLTQDSDASGDYYFKVTPVKYNGSSWQMDSSQTVTVSNTTGYNAYLDLSLNLSFQDINYALIETESALVSEVLVSA